MIRYCLLILVGFIGSAVGLFSNMGPAVDLWLSADEVSRILGRRVSEPLYIIQDGLANPSMSPSLLRINNDSLYDPNFIDQKTRFILPANIDSLKISWRAPKPFHYTFMQLQSSDPSLMGPPLLSITLEDSMPNNNTEFRMDFPCTGERTGIASVNVILRIRHFKSGLDIPASPIHLSFDKQCVEAPTCEPRCANGGVCNQLGRCDCAEGFYGHSCRIIFCIPHCYNSGTCVAPGVCECKKGFIGDRCQKAICKDDCNGHGYCYKPGSCYCYRGWTGPKCDKRIDNSAKALQATSYRSKNFRLVKNRRFWGDSS
ncbi:wnt inhibitory factor 1-like [Lytechinus pictus]|uniref:wnt inhibitory factor 1-like n=1 Tax=Lytechinus pictus TaxID=7653 RepID=UPI0030BA2272